MAFGAGQVQVTAKPLCQVAVYGIAFALTGTVAVDVDDAIRRLVFTAAVGPDNAGLIVGFDGEAALMPGDFSLNQS